MATERDRKSELKDAYDQAWGSFGPWQLKAESDIRAVNKNAWTENDLRKMLKQKRDPMTFPLIRRNINWISGYQREHLLSIKYDPAENADARTADQFTNIATWVLQHSNYYYTSSDAFEFALKAGINLVNTYNDRNGDTAFDRYAYNQFVLDPTFRSRSLRDCQYGILRKHINRTEAKMLFPGKEAFIDSIAKTSDAQDDEMFTNYHRPTLYGSSLLAADEFQQRTTKNQKFILFKPTNTEVLWPGTNAELKDAIEYEVQVNGMNPNLISVIAKTERTVEVTAYLNGEEMWTKVDPFGISDFSFTPVIAYFDPDADCFTDKIQGVARLLVDSQRASDQRMMAMMATFDMQAGAGMDFEEDTLLDDEDAFTTEPGKPRKFKKGAISGLKYKDRVIPDIPAGMFQLHDTFDKNMPKMININEEMFGVPPKGKMQIAGMLAKLRVGTGLIGQRGLFHNFALSTKMIGGKALKLFQHYTPDKVRRILNEDPAPGFTKRDFGKYDAVAAEGMLTDTQNNQFYAELIAMKEMGAKVGDPFPASWKTVINFMPIQAKVKNELIKEMEQREQQAQQAKQKADEMQQVAQMLEIKRVEGEILGNRGIAAAQQAKAVEDMSDAALNRVKTLTEINDIGEQRILELARLGLQFEQLSQQNQEIRVKS